MADMQIVRRGTPPPPTPTPWGDDTPFYWEGQEFEGGWKVGTELEGTGSATKEVERLALSISTSSTTLSVRTFVMNSKIDFTNLSILKVDWEVSQTGSNRDVGFVLYITPLNTEVTGSVAFARENTKQFSRATTSLDVSGITGEYFLNLRVGLGGQANPQYTVNAKTHRIWGVA